MTLNKQQHRSVTALKIFDSVLTSLVRSFLIFMTTITAFTLTGTNLVNTLTDAFLFAGSIAIGSLLYDLVTKGLYFINNLLIQKEVHKLMGDLMNNPTTNKPTLSEVSKLPNDGRNLN